MYGQTPLHYAAQYNNSDVIDMLIKHGADVNASDLYGKTLLPYTVDNNDSEVIDFLI